MIDLFVVFLFLILLIIGIVSYKFRLGVFLSLKYVYVNWSKILVSSFGVMLAIAMIISSGVVSDSVGATLLTDNLRGTGNVDLLINSPLMDFFNDSLETTIRNDEVLDQYIDGVGSWIWFSRLPTLNVNSEIISFSSSLLAINPHQDKEIGSLELVDSNSQVNLSTLQISEVFITEKLFSEINSSLNDRISLTVRSESLGVMKTINYTIKGIVKNEGFGNFNQGKNIFTSLSNLRSNLGLNTSSRIVNTVAISLKGGISDSLYYETDAIEYLNNTILNKGSESLEIVPFKSYQIKESEEGRSSIGALFNMLSATTVSASIVLIVILFYMLADDRKKEIGTLRAMGVSREQVFVALMVESVALILLAGSLGIPLGVIFAWAFIFLLSQLNMGEGWYFTRGVPMDRMYELAIVPESLLNGFLLGATIAFVVSLLATFFISKLNPIEAMRDLDSSPLIGSESNKALTLLHLSLSIILICVGVAFYLTDNFFFALFITAGGILIFLALTPSLWPTHYRKVVSVTSLVLTIGSFTVTYYYVTTAVSIDIEEAIFFVLVSILMTVFISIFFSINSDIILIYIEKMLSFIIRKPHVVLVTISQLRRGVFKQLLTILLFAIVFSFLLIAITFEDSNQAYQQRRMAYSTLDRDNLAVLQLPINNLKDLENTLNDKLNYKIAVDMGWNSRDLSPLKYDGTIENANDNRRMKFLQDGYYTVICFDNETIDDPTFKDLVNLGRPKENIEETLEILKSGLGALIPHWFTRYNIEQGKNITFIGETHNESIPIIGECDVMFGGIYISEKTFNALYPSFSGYRMIFIDAVDDLDSDEYKALTYELRKEFSLIGGQVFSLEEFKEEFIGASSIIYNFMNIYLYMGLVIGSLGMGLIVAKNLRDRAKEHAMLLAIGQTHRDLFLGIFIEIFWLLTTSIVIGTVSALSFMELVKFTDMPMDIGAISLGNVILFGVLLLIVLSSVTIFPWRRITKIKVAEVLKFNE